MNAHENSTGTTLIRDAIYRAPNGAVGTLSLALSSTKDGTTYRHALLIFSHDDERFCGTWVNADKLEGPLTGVALSPPSNEDEQDSSTLLPPAQADAIISLM